MDQLLCLEAPCSRSLLERLHGASKRIRRKHILRATACSRWPWCMILQTSTRSPDDACELVTGGAPDRLVVTNVYYLSRSLRTVKAPTRRFALLSRIVSTLVTPPMLGALYLYLFHYRGFSAQTRKWYGSLLLRFS